MLETKNSVTKMKNTFVRFISRLDRVRKKIFELEDISTETSKDMFYWLSRIRNTSTISLCLTEKGLNTRVVEHLGW